MDNEHMGRVCVDAWTDKMICRIYILTYITEYLVRTTCTPEAHLCFVDFRYVSTLFVSLVDTDISLPLLCGLQLRDCRLRQRVNIVH